ncbi:MAG TPA: MFS transporter [Acidimicrobiales bacterium]|nr:MFS transporter [Acidimicrobiales bacterium]
MATVDAGRGELGGGPAPIPPGPDGRARRRGVLAICSLSLFIVSLDNTIVNVALPSLQAQFHASVSGLQWVIDAYLLVLAALLLLSGSSGDRFGRRRVFQLGLAVFGVGSLLCSLAPSLPALVVFRMLQAVGGSMLNPNSLSIISSTFTDRREKAAAIGIWGGVSGLSTAAGPIVGGLLIQAVDWRAVFWVNIPIVVAAFVLTRRYVPESRAERPRPLDLPGQGLAVVVLAALIYGIIGAPARGWTSTPSLACFAVTAVALVAFLRVEARREQPLLELRFFRSPPFSGATAIATLAFLVLAGWLFLNTLYLQEVRGDSALVAGLSTLPATLIIAVVAPLTGRVVGRSGARAPLVASGLFLAAGTAVLVFDTPTSSYLLLAGGYLLLGLGFGLVNPPISNTAVTGMPPAQAGTASAVASTARQVGSALGVAILGSVVTSQFHRQLADRAAAAHLSPAGRAHLLHAQLGAGGIGGGGPTGDVLRSAFTAASDAGWLVTTGAGLAIAVVGAASAGPWALARARHALDEVDAPS